MMSPTRRRWAAWVIVVSACGRTELLDVSDSGEDAVAIDSSDATTPSTSDSGDVDQGVDSGVFDSTSDYDWPETVVPDARREHVVDAACDSGRWTFGSIATYATPPFSGDENGGPVLGAGDFDGDGTLDLIGVFSSPSAAAIWTNLGDGTFGLETNLAIVAGAYVLAVGDFNRDGLADFAVGFVADVNTNGANLDGVEVFTNQGNAGFAITSSFPATNGALDMVVGDFNGDGAPDIAMADNSNQLNIALNRGDGTFPAVVSYQAGYALGLAMAVGDVNNDGALDIVSTSAAANSAMVSVFFNRGDGTFESPVSYSSIGEDTGCLALGDFNGDGWLDVARTSWQAGNYVAVRLNRGDGTFETESSYPVGDMSYAIVADRFLSSSGWLDIAAAPLLGSFFAGDTTVVVLPGNGDGTFGQKLGIGTLGANVLLAGDFNGDGHPDISFASGSAFGVLPFVCE